MSTKTRKDSMAKQRDVHPVADLFPMLADDELAELAEDIKQRGLLQPIVLDPEGRVLDGRNRLAACALVEVKPAFMTYDGDDPGGYALAVNIARRHLTKGQQAMVAARALLVSNSSQSSIANSVRVSQGRIGQAVTVRDHAPDLADAVVAGAMGLDEAYRIARENKTKGESAEAQLAKLRAEDPELADKVVEGELTLAGAWAERRARAELERKDIEAAQRSAKVMVNEFRSTVVTVVTGSRLGATDLITQDMVRELREVIDLLEGEL
jgi:ParB/RepB/Spo0J family partition protein